MHDREYDDADEREIDRYIDIEIDGQVVLWD